MGLYSSRGQNAGTNRLLPKVQLRRSLAFGIIILVALLAFEIFNYSTTDYALSDLLGTLRFAGVRWATILSIAFCGIDFAGIARLFTPEQGTSEPTEVWYLFGAWLLAATMNAILTWWGVSMAIVNHQLQSTSVIDNATVMKIVPIFVAVMVWLIRILIIGSLSYTGDKLLWSGDQVRGSTQAPVRSLLGSNSAANAQSSASFRPAPKPVSQPEASFGRPEPTYHNASMSSSGSGPSGIREPVKPETRR